MSEKFLLGIDAGTSMVKAIVFDLSGQEVACVSKRLSIEIAKPGWAEQDMDSTWEAVRETIRRSLKKYKLASENIVAVGIYSSVEDAARKVIKLKREYYPNPGNHQKYQQLYKLYQSLYQHLWDDWDLRVKVVNNP